MRPRVALIIAIVRLDISAPDRQYRGPPSDLQKQTSPRRYTLSTAARDGAGRWSPPVIT